jgi:hypothetical protein
MDRRDLGTKSYSIFGYLNRSRINTAPTSSDTVDTQCCTYLDTEDFNKRCRIESLRIKIGSLRKLSETRRIE